MKTAKYLKAVVSVALSFIVAVDCLSKGRQQKLDYLCRDGIKYTVLPWDCKGYLQCTTDWNAHWMDCPPHQFWSQFLMTCGWNSSECNDPQATAKQECQNNPSITFPSQDSCAKYYDCSQTYPKYGLKQYENECPYPQLYDDVSETCKAPYMVNCGKRRRPFSRADYVLENGPCKGRPDGTMPIPNQPFSNYYLYCRGGETSIPRKCFLLNEVFDPMSMKCTTDYKVSIMTYCVNHPTARFPVANNCAKYYDCKAQSHNRQLEFYQTECNYTMLYDPVTGTCKPYDQVDCGDRFEPKSPCEYSVGHCTPGGSCIQCEADCKDLEDGKHAFTASTNTADYLECKGGRTIAINTCADGYIFSYNDCVDRAGKTVENNPIQTSGAQPVGDITGSGFQSTSEKGDLGTDLGFKDVVVYGRGSVVPTGGIPTGTQNSQGSTLQDPSQTSQGTTGQNPSQSSGGSTSQDPSQSSGGSTSQDPSQSSGGSTSQDPSQTSGGSTSQNSSQSSGGSTSQDPSQDPSQTSGGSTSQDPSQSSGGSTSQDPSQSSGGSTSQDPSQSSGGSTSQDPSQSSGGSTSQDPSQSSGGSTSQDPSQTSGGSTSQNSSQSSGGSTSQDPSQDPSQSSGGSTSQDPSQSSGGSTSQDPSQSSGGSTSQDPSQTSGGSTSQNSSTSSGGSTSQDPSQDPSQSSGGSTSQDPSQSSGGSTSQDPSQASGGSTSQDPSQSSGGSTSQDPSQSSGGSTSQDPSQSSGGSTSQDPSQTSGGSTSQNSSQSSGGSTSQDPSQDPSQSSGGSTSQDPSQSSGGSTSQDPSQSSGGSTSQDPSQSSGGSTSQDPSQTSGGSTSQDPSQSSGGSTSQDPSQDPSQSSGGSTSQDPSQSSGGSTSQDPSQSSGGSTSQDPSQSSGGSTSQDPSQSSGGSTSQDPSQSSGGSTSQDPSQTSGGSTSQNSSTSSGGSTSQDPSQDPSQSSGGSTSQDPSQSSGGSTSQDPSQSSGGSTSQDPSQTSGGSTSQNSSTSSGGSTSQDPSQSSGGSTSQDPSQTSGGSTSQNSSTSSGGSTSQDPSQDPSQSSGGSTSQDPSQSSGGSTSPDPSQSSGGSTSQDPSQSSGGSTSQDPSQSSQGSTSQDPSQSSQSTSQPEPIIQYYCNCTDEVNAVTDKIKPLEDFVAEQRQLNALNALECKNPPTLARAKTGLLHTVTGAEATYTCNPGYSFCGSRAASTCPGNGIWETVDGICVQSVWNYPRVLFRQKFLCPFTAGTVITIYGTPTRYKKAMIQLESGADRALVMTMCFQCGSTQEKVTFAIEEDGVSKHAITWDKFPFKVGKEFKVVISVTQSAYKIEIDTAPPYYFSHELPVPHVESLAIIDEITIRKVIIEPSNTLQTFMPDLTTRQVPDQSINVKDTTSFTFKVKACENMEFKLASYDTDTSQSYIVSLGASGNNMSSIRKCDTCNNRAVVWHQALSCSDFRPFWVMWDSGIIKVGSGYIPGKNDFLEVADTEYPINYFRISQSDVNSAEWILSTPIQKCGLPPPMPDSDVIIQEAGLVAEAVYTCRNIYTFCGESHVSRCTEEGTWEGYKGECLQSTWHMLRMPASLRFPCSFGFGSVLSIHGTSMGGFTVSLNSGADALMKMIVETGRILYNYNINQVEGVPVVNGSFQISPGQTFHLTIKVESNQFKVAVDGTVIHEFIHNFLDIAPFHTLNSASIKDRVFIRKVQVFPSEEASSDCQQPSPILNGQVSTVDTTVGSEVEYTCNADHFFCGSSSLIVCDNHGNWNGFDGSCEKGTWYNLDRPTTAGLVWQFPCRYQAGFTINMKVIPLKDEPVNPYFSIEIQDKTETLLVMDFYKTELKMNSRLPDLGTEEAAVIPELVIQTPIDIKIMIIDSEFMIYLGTTLVHSFKHRTHVARASAIVFFPSIDITELKFGMEF